MELIEVILSKENLNRAYKKVVSNKGASGVDGVTVEELGDYAKNFTEKFSYKNLLLAPPHLRYQLASSLCFAGMTKTPITADELDASYLQPTKAEKDLEEKKNGGNA